MLARCNSMEEGRSVMMDHQSLYTEAIEIIIKVTDNENTSQFVEKLILT